MSRKSVQLVAVLTTVMPSILLTVPEVTITPGGIRPAGLVALPIAVEDCPTLVFK